MSRVLLDTNIVVRYAYSPSPEHSDVVSAVNLLFTKGHSLYVTPQVLREFWSVATRPVATNGLGLTSKEAERSIEVLLREFVFADDEPGIFATWLDLVVRHGVRGTKVHDANHAATARHHGITHVLTLNPKDFQRYALSGLSVVTPADVIA